MIILNRFLNEAENNKIEALNRSVIKLQEVKMVKELPKFKGYTVDEKLRQFRKVDKGKPSIDFVDFDSDEGSKLLEEYEESQQ